jgi:hypothetical protein
MCVKKVLVQVRLTFLYISLKLQDTRYKIQDTRYKIQDTRHKIQDKLTKRWRPT